MPLTIEEVERVAGLAKLEFDQAEKDLLVKELNSMLTYIDTLNEVDTSAVEPLTRMEIGGSALREDESRPSPPQEDMMRNAPERSGSFFGVPKVIGAGT